VVADSSDPPQPAASSAAPTSGANQVARVNTGRTLRGAERPRHHPRRMKRRRRLRATLAA
jgi:hypothetical protein